MRNLLINLLAPALLLAATTIVSGQSSQQPKPPKADEPPPAKNKDTSAKSKLEQMLEIALKNNPDIRVADAKAREADAEVNRTRLAVTQKVVALYNDIEAARANVQLAETQVARMRNLNKSNVVAREEIDAAEAKLVQAKATLAKLEADIPYLLGLSNLKGNLETILSEVGKANAEELKAKATVSQRMLYWLELDRARALDQAAANQALRAFRAANDAAVSDKLRAALNTPVTFEVVELVSLQNFLPLLKIQQPDLMILDKTTGLPPVRPVHFKAVPLGVVLQWLEDELGDNRIVVRDYGLLIVGRDKIPPGAVLLDEIWKNNEKTKAKDEKK